MGLFLLGRKLMQIAESGLPQGKITTSVRLVLADVAYHPGSSITEITERTGFPQSLVSLAVAKLREVGIVESEPDPSDRRRTLVRTTAALEERQQRADTPSIEALVAKELPAEQQKLVLDAGAALDLLARLLIPEVLDDADAPVTPSGPGGPRRAGAPSGGVTPPRSLGANSVLSLSWPLLGTDLVLHEYIVAAVRRPAPGHGHRPGAIALTRHT
jgi:DNA-binding MarR family transcriptional regulator